MRFYLASRIMRTTVDTADPILEDVRRVQREEEKPLGAVVTELLAEGLAARRGRRGPALEPFEWPAQDLRPRIDLDDKETVRKILDAEEGYPHR